jgi:hypothetical protein
MSLDRKTEQPLRYGTASCVDGLRHARVFYVKRRGHLRSCVRPFCAVALGPLALMDSAGRGLISWSGFESL